MLPFVAVQGARKVFTMGSVRLITLAPDNGSGYGVRPLCHKCGHRISLTDFSIVLRVLPLIERCAVYDDGFWITNFNATSSSGGSTLPLAPALRRIPLHAFALK